MSTRPTPEELAELALVGRLSRGIQHRINNLMTVLIISSQQVQELGGAPEAERREIQDILDRTVDQLGLLSDVFTGTTDTADVARALRAVASVVSGVSHQTTITVEPESTPKPAAVDAVVLHRLLISACLLAHSSAPSGGDVRLGCTDADSMLRVLVRCVPRHGSALLRISELDEGAAQDVALILRLADGYGIEVGFRDGADVLEVELALPSRR